MRLVTCIFIISVLMGCASLNKSLNPVNYLSWYSSTDFGWKGLDTVQGTMMCTMRLFPKEVDIAKCALENCENKETLKDQLAIKEETVDFIIEFASLKPGISLFELPGTVNSSRAERIMYFSSGIKNDIKGITSSGDTLVCESVLYEPSLPQKARILISIEKSKKSMNQLLIRDRIISGETIRFSIPELTNKTIPTLKL